MEKYIEKIQDTARVFFSRGIIIKICFIIVLLFFLIALLAPILTPFSPTEQSLTDALLPPQSSHLFGTDQLGRDLLTRILYGARISVITSLLSSVFAMAIGVSLGLLSGFYGGWVGQTIMRITDAQLSIPPLIISMTLASVFDGGLLDVSLVIGISMLPTYIRMVNGLVLTLKENDYVVAGRLIGQSQFKLLYKHLLPNCFPSIIVLFTMNLGSAIMQEASLSFLGIGITAPTPAWGSMVSDGYKYLLKAPSLALIPGICILIIVIAFNICGDGLRDALDPRLRGKL